MVTVGITVMAQPYKRELQALDKYFEASLATWEVPGMAVAIVKNGQVIFEKGYGLRSTESNDPVDQHTAFAIASNTKAVTAAALAILVDEGKLAWDDKVQKYLPWFQLYDPYVSANLTVRDLLCHRSGLGTFSGDLLWYGSQHNRRAVLERAKYLKPKYDFRSTYGYQNILFLAAGEIVPVVTGQTWEAFITERILTKLDVTDTYLSTSELDRAGNVALPHNEVKGSQQPVAWVNWDNIAPAGSIITSVNDWAKWLMLQLGEGELDGEQFWSKTRTREMWSMHTPKEISEGRQKLYTTLQFSGYGLGWELFSHHGRKIVAHGGGYDGMVSRSVLVPEEGLGMIVVTNTNTILSYAMTYRILDVMLGVRKPEDWSSKFYDLVEANKSEEDPNKLNSVERIADTNPSCDLEVYAGTYADRMYGNIEVRLVGDQLMFQFEPTPIFRGTFRHYHYDTFCLNWSTQMMLPSGLARFVLGDNGLPQELYIDVQNPDFDFTELIFRRLD